MRPAKVVLCVCGNAEVLSRRVFLLETWGYRVQRAAMPAEALAMLAGAETDSVDLLLIEHTAGDVEELIRHGKGMHPELRVMVVSAVPNGSSNADVWLPAAYPNSELRERVRVLTARKRGPKALKKSAGTVTTLEKEKVA